MRNRQPRLLCEERRREILRLLEDHGRVTVDSLADSFRVSAVTIRGDLEELGSKGLLVRSHGGAIPPLSPQQEYPLQLKKTLHHTEKVRIGRAAAQLIQPRQTVIIDGGTTTAEVARALKRNGSEGLTVITHALNIAVEFADSPNISLIVIGGVFRHISRSFVGPPAERMISDLHADHFFLAVDGLDPEMGPSTPDVLEAQLNAQMIRAAREVSVVADATKFGRRSLSLIGDIRSVHRVITDSRVNEETVCCLRKMGIEVLVV
ncbi:MAG TPA: DeoR/GlpR family DNA-binding transcription regulator [Terriglobales bacterium]|jgi:DeoR family transcriptional regulator of aga operon|nr:DeoR/GlpR family DNA-binding transcription regulator [Terriglobales bacterium]